MSPLRSIGIELKHHRNELWTAVVNFSTNQHAEPTCISGSIGPHYVLELHRAIDLAKESAEAIGVTFVDAALYVENDGDSSELLPADWRDQIQAQSKRLGWTFIYEPKAAPDTKHSTGGMTP